MEQLFPAGALDDSSLALPAEPARRPAGKVAPREASVRVQQQVRLTMARRARKGKGGFSLQKSRAESFDDTDTLLHTTKQATDWGITNPSFSSGHIGKPSLRLELPSPVDLEFGPHHPGTPTQPWLRPPGWAAAPSDHSFRSDWFRCCSSSRATCAARTPTATAPLETFHWGPPPFSGSAQQSLKSGSQRSFRQERLPGWGPGAPRPDGGPAWLAQARRDAGALRRVASRQTSFGGVETDGWSPLVGPAVHQIHTQGAPTTREETPAEMTVERAVSLLGSHDEDALLSAAAHLQAQCCRSADAKKAVYFLRGVEKLLPLLRSHSESVQSLAAGALRNLVYQSDQNKMEVEAKGGLGAILQALKSSRDMETRRELTGLLWNLSSHDLLKERLSAEAPSVLTRSVLVPTSGLSEGENPKDELLADGVAFHHATGCLWNLSSAGPGSRKAMRECEDLIDSLVYYIRGTIADYKMDDKSTENCVCILHNLSYQLEEQLPRGSVRVLRESRHSLAPRPSAVGCFARRSAKITERREECCPLLEEKSNPQGPEWLWSTITVRMYLSLLARSTRQGTQAAALGALQNITAGNGALSRAIAFTVVQRENGLQHVRKMLEEGGSDVRRTAVALLRNASRYQELHAAIVEQVLPELVRMLPDCGADLGATATVCLCDTLNSLSRSQRQHVRALLAAGALPGIVALGRNGPGRAGQAARDLLRTMWSYSDLHGTYKKLGFAKADFIPARSSKIICT